MDPKMEEHYKELELKMQILNHWRQQFIFFCGIVVSACALCGWLINLCLQHFEFLKKLTTNSTPEAILLMCILMIVVLIGSIGIVSSHERKKTMDLIKQERKLTESDLISIVDSHISWLILGGVKWLGLIALGAMIFLKDFNIKKFERYDEEWLDYVGRCRKGTQNVCYDVVEGGIANDKVFNTIDLYFAGIMSKDNALGRLAFEHPNHQICILNQEVINRHLHFVTSEEIIIE